MKQVNKILELAQNNNGMISNNMVHNAGLSRGVLKYMVDTNRLEKVARGTYIIPNIFEDEMFVMQNKYKKGIYSLTTALYLWGLTDRTPIEFNMTFPAYYNLTSPIKDGIICNKASQHIYELGVTDIKNNFGTLVKVYNMEKTIADILRKTNNMDIQIIADAIKLYVKRDDKNIPLLSEYAKKLRVTNHLQRYMEVLL